MQNSLQIIQNYYYYYSKFYVQHVTLNHEVADNPVKLGTVVETSPRQLGEVSARDRGVLPIQLDGYFTHPKYQV